MSFLMNKKKYELSFSGHETFPLRQMWLKKVIDLAADNDEILKKEFSDPQRIAELGVGKNMLSAMRHWALACETITQGKSNSYYDVTEFGKSIFDNNGLDPYSEHPTTTWLMHWKLAKKGSKSTTLYWVFNHLNTPSFSKDELIQKLKAECSRNNKVVSENSINKDIDTSLRGYLSKSDNGNGEDIADPIFAELNLMSSDKSGHYIINRGPKPSLNTATFTYALLEFWKPFKEESNTLSLDDITYGDSSPGKIFKLDEDSIIEKLLTIDDITDGKIKWSNTAGIKQISKSDFDFDKLMLDMLRRAYAE